MRMKKIVENLTLKSAAAEFIAFKRAQKIRERTLHDYQNYINPFVEQSSNSMDIDVLKQEILEYFANIPATSPARYNHPYQYLHGEPVVYGISDGMKLDLRCYTITAVVNDTGVEYAFTIEGTHKNKQKNAPLWDTDSKEITLDLLANHSN